MTLFGIFLTPVFYSVVRWFTGPGPVATGPGSNVHVFGLPDPEVESGDAAASDSATTAPGTPDPEAADH